MLFPPRKQGLTSDTVVSYLGGDKLCCFHQGNRGQPSSLWVYHLDGTDRIYL